MTSRSTRGYAVATLLIALGGCAGAPAGDTQSPPLHVLYTGEQCGSEAPGVAIYADAPAARVALRAADIEPAGVLPAERADIGGYVRISMGERPTAGYAVTPLPSASRRDGEQLTVVAKWQRPPADALSAQVITYPCAWLSVAAPAPTDIRIVDAAQAPLLPDSVSGAPR